jgi:hypothetical protein
MTAEERLEKLERELGRAKRRSRWLLAALGLGLGAFGLAWIFARAAPTLQAQVGAGAERVVHANRFVLEDAAGREVAVLEIGPDGPVLRLRDAAGMPRAVVGMTADGPALGLLDENGKVRAGLRVGADGSGLGLFDANGKPRAGLALDKDGPELALFGENGKEIWSTLEGDKGKRLPKG